MSAIRVLVVDDQPLIRSAVSTLLGQHTGIEVVGEAADGLEAVASAAALRPDLVLMDIRMPNLDGIAATARICAAPALAATRVLILTTFEEDEYVVQALRAGASGFIGKGAEPDAIVRAVLAVHAGDALLSPVATRALIERFVGATAGAIEPAAEPPALAHLTEREREVLALIAKGIGNDEIADRLFISHHTVKTHVKHVMAKLAAHDRAQLVIIAYEHGLVVAGT